MGLNKRGYMLVEMILASVLAFSVGYFLINLTYKFNDTNSLIYNSMENGSIKDIITKNIMSDLESGIVFDDAKSGNSITFNITLNKNGEIQKRKLMISNGNTIIYGKINNDGSYDKTDVSYYIKKLPNGLKFNSMVYSNGSNFSTVYIPIKSLYDDEKYDLKFVLRKYSDESIITYDGQGATNQGVTNLMLKYDGYFNDKNNAHSSSSTVWYGEDRRLHGSIHNGTWGADYLQFNGTTTYVNSNMQLTTAVTAYTIETTFMLDSLPNAETWIFSNVNAGGLGLVITSANKLRFQAYIGGDWYTATSTTTLQTGVKYHAAGVFNNGNMYLYLNGVLVISRDVSSVGTTVGIATNNTQFTLGCDPTGASCSTTKKFFHGKIYGASLYQRALSAAEVAADYGKTVTFGKSYGNLPTPLRVGYTFNGWYTDVSGGTKITSTSVYNIPGSSTLHARWKPNNYVITVNPAGGTYTKGSNKYSTVNDYTVSFDNEFYASNPTRSGYTFAGWTYTNGDASRARYGTSSGNATNNRWTNGTTKVKGTYFTNLRSTAGTVILTANWS